MLKKLLTILASALTLTSALLARKRRQTRAEISQAVHTGDQDAVTKHHHDLLKVVILVGLFGLSGCVKERVVVVNQPMVPVPMEYNGTPGWWLSNALYEATLLKLEELKHE